MVVGVRAMPLIRIIHIMVVLLYTRETDCKKGDSVREQDISESIKKSTAMLSTHTIRL